MLLSLVVTESEIYFVISVFPNLYLYKSEYFSGTPINAIAKLFILLKKLIFPILFVGESNLFKIIFSDSLFKLAVKIVLPEADNCAADHIIFG